MTTPEMRAIAVFFEHRYGGDDDDGDVVALRVTFDGLDDALSARITDYLVDHMPEIIGEKLVEIAGPRATQ